MRRAFLLLLVVFVLAVACATGSDNDAARAQSIEAQVWSPYCPGRLLIDCATRQARELRAEIAGRVERGETTDEVLTWVRGEFGESAMARPSGGPALVIWLVPAAIFLIGSVILVRAVRKWRMAPARMERSDPL